MENNDDNNYAFEINSYLVPSIYVTQNLKAWRSYLKILCGSS